MFGCVCTSLCVHLNARGWYHKSVLVTFHFVFYIYLLCIWVFNKTGSDEIVPVCTRHVMSCMWRQEDNLWNSVVARKRVPGIELGLLLLFWRGFCCCFISFVLQAPLTANQNHLLYFFLRQGLSLSLELTDSATLSVPVSCRHPPITVPAIIPPHTLPQC